MLVVIVSTLFRRLDSVEVSMQVTILSLKEELAGIAGVFEEGVGMRSEGTEGISGEGPWGIFCENTECISGERP